MGLRIAAQHLSFRRSLSAAGVSYGELAFVDNADACTDWQLSYDPASGSLLIENSGPPTGLPLRSRCAGLQVLYGETPPNIRKPLRFAPQGLFCQMDYSSPQIRSV